MDEFGFRILDNHLKEFAIPITPESFRRLLKRDKHEEMLYDLMKKAGITCSLVCLSVRWRVSERSQTQPLARAFLKCKIPSCTSKFVGQLNEQPVKEAMPMKFCRIGKISHASDDTEAINNFGRFNEKNSITCLQCKVPVLREDAREHRLNHCPFLPQRKREWRPSAKNPSSVTDMSRNVAPLCLICFQQYLWRDVSAHKSICKIINTDLANIELSKRDFESELVFPVDDSKHVIVCNKCQDEFSELSQYHEHLVIEHGSYRRKRFSNHDEYNVWFRRSKFAFSCKRARIRSTKRLLHSYRCRVRNKTKCEAFLRVYFSNIGPAIMVEYNDVHNHVEQNRQIGKLTPACRSFIFDSLKQGCSDKEVLAKARGNLESCELETITLSAIKGIRRRFFINPLISSTIDLDNIDMNSIRDQITLPKDKFDPSVEMISEEIEGDLLERNDSQQNVRTTDTAMADTCDIDAREPDLPVYDSDSPQPETFDMEALQSDNSVGSVSAPQLEPSEHRSATSLCSSRQHFRDFTFPLLMKAFDNPKVSDRQWEEIKFSVIRIFGSKM